jgi:hypothetical protein
MEDDFMILIDLKNGKKITVEKKRIVKKKNR